MKVSHWLKLKKAWVVKQIAQNTKEYESNPAGDWRPVDHEFNLNYLNGQLDLINTILRKLNGGMLQ